jgi:UDP-N-acetylglucosamine--N-acetylmuramyl-(pentapeptide) pyrophosphoryl-undecaprenol N-acetylglucosamine transferase
MEQNVYPGLANRVLGRRATFVAVPDAAAAAHFPGRAVVTGNPVRPEFKAIPARCPRLPLAILVTGGSQGAESVNRAVLDALSRLEGWQDRLRFVHQTGKRQVDETRSAYAAAGFRAEVESFFTDFDARYAAADLIVCRAGATTIAEVRASGRAAIFIPLASAADDHQRRNARAMVEAGAAVMIDPVELSGGRLAAEIVGLLEAPERMAAMESNARRMAVLDAESRIADLIEKAAGKA